MCVSSAPERGGGGEGAERERERERERVPRLEQMPPNVACACAPTNGHRRSSRPPPPSKKKKFLNPQLLLVLHSTHYSDI